MRVALVLLVAIVVRTSATDHEDRIRDAFALLHGAGIQGLCHPTISLDPYFYRCDSVVSERIRTFNVRRRLQTPGPPFPPTSGASPYIPFAEGAVPETIDWTSILMATLCVLCAAICAGLIMGILSLDELMLHIKIRAGSDPLEQAQAEKLLPLVKQRHLVLVSLLLLNFLADECLPIFLDNLLPTWMAVLTSVFLVVFISEIVPSAVFIGPDQLRLASKISSFAYVVIWIFYPIAYPIAKLLDWLLQGEDELGNVYNRGELSALVRLQYEGRMAAKRRELAERRRQQIEEANQRDDMSDVSDLPSIIMSTTDETLHLAEVNIVQAALNLKTTSARDVCTKLRKAYTIPHDMILDQANVARIYGVGYSRVPVYFRNPRRPKDINAIVGILMTRQLIVLRTDHRRSVASMPLYQPVCVAPGANMIEMLHIFQAGSSGNKGGHMALVCDKPEIATAALESRKPIPPEAGVLGILTLEDVIEELLQEPIYDEGDRAEREAMERAEWAFNKWRLYTRRRRRQSEPFCSPLSFDLEHEIGNHEQTPLMRSHKNNGYGVPFPRFPLPFNGSHDSEL